MQNKSLSLKDQLRKYVLAQLKRERKQLRKANELQTLTSTRNGRDKTLTRRVSSN